MVRDRGLDGLIWTLAISVVLILSAPLIPYLTRRIVIADGEIAYRSLLRRRKFAIAAVIAIATVDVGIRAPDPQLVLIGRQEKVLLRLHLPFWPEDVEQRLRKLGAQSSGDWLRATAVARVSALRPLRWTFLIMLPVQALLFGGLGASLLVNSLVTLPSAYDELSTSGVAVTAHVVRCIGEGNAGCDLSVTYRGIATTWTYPLDFSQFTEAGPGSPVALLVDPTSPSVRYTAYDVQTRFNAGFGFAAVLGLVMVGMAVLFAAAWVRILRARHRTSPENGLTLSHSGDTARRR
jgi:hypothetical protein